MFEGEIRNGKVWYGFDAQELEWLYNLIPSGDVFKDRVARGMRDLQNSSVERTESLHLVDFSQEELLVLKNIARREMSIWSQD